MSGAASQETEQLLQFLYQTPIGLAELDDAGKVLRLNALGVQLLLPLAPSGDVENLLQVLAPSTWS